MSPNVNAFADMMTQTIVWEQRTGTDEYGQGVFGAGQNLTCRIVSKERGVRTVDGGEAVSTTTIYVLGDYGITSVDRVTLPDGSQPVIVDVKSYPDENGPHHQEVLT
jgi:hypothetical protein